MSWRYYDLFISHGWRYDERYRGIVRLLDSDPYFYWRDYSAPRDHPVADPESPVGQRILTRRLDEKIRQVSCFVIADGMYVYHRPWVQRELAIARRYAKPIVAVRFLGQQRVAVELDDADARVGWRAGSIISAIREVAR